jgi:serine/threonine protein kinase/Tol biopolymer transport system component
MPLAAGARLGPYEINAWLGAGGMGDVYRATDTRLDRSVALKVLPDHVACTPTRRARFAREARAVSRLSHPSICALYDVGEHDGLQFIVMEYLEGETLSQCLRRGPLPIADVFHAGAEIADALDHAHRHAVVHRDLKPANIMLTRTGVKLLDFGLARLESRNEEVMGATAVAPSPLTESLTEDGLILGTVQYMAPEQLEGKRVDGRTDIFALGAVLYEMATGQPAFQAPSKASLIAAILGRPATPVSVARQAATGEDFVPPLLDDIVAKCLAKNPDERWQAASDLCQALKWAGVRPSHTEVPLRSVPRRWRDYHPGWVAWSVLMLASLTAVALMVNGERASSVARPLRWLVTAPEGSTFDPSGYSLALSPDGTHLAFIASSKGGDNALWVRPLDSVVPRKLADGAAQPFWSSDSRSIGFDGGGQLKKVDIDTGLVKPLADTFVQSGSWNRSGLLLLGLPRGERRYNPPGLYTVSASGGQLTRATTLDPERAEFNHILPHFLPDGRRFLFMARSNDPDQDGMFYAGSLDSSERVQLIQSRSRTVYASGYLLFMKDRTLLAQKFDPLNLRLEGEPAVVADDVETGLLNAAFSVSETGVLAYRPSRQTELVWFDRSGRSLGSIGEPGRYANPVLSPDEQRVAVSRQDALGAQSNVWVIDLRRRVPSKLTFGETSEGMPVWSPDGRRVVYRSGRSLVMKASNGTGPEERLAEHLTNFDNPLDWSSDGKLLFTSFDSTSSTDLWLWSLDGDQKRVPLPRSGSRWGVQAQISPGGRWLAYASNESGRYDVYVRPFPSGEGKWLITPSGGSEPSWRRDGKELYYLAADGSLVAVPVTTKPAFEPGTPTRLFETKMSTLVNTSFTRNQYVASADGQRFLVNQATGTPASIVVVVDWPAGLKHGQ